MRTRDDDEAPGRTVVMALAAMVAVALVVGLVLGVVVMSVVRISGVGTATEVDEQAPASLYLPDYQPTTPSDEGGNASGTVTSPSPSPSQTRTRPPRDRIELVAAPQSAAPGDRISFSGVYKAGEGASLQIQRKENGVWTDFPVSTTVTGGSFETWIQTTHTGPMRFRVYDEVADRGSNVVLLTIG